MVVDKLIGFKIGADVIDGFLEGDPIEGVCGVMGRICGVLILRIRGFQRVL